VTIVHGIVVLIMMAEAALKAALNGMSEAELKAITALAQAIATVLSAFIIGVAGAFITSLFNRRRDQEQRESWWRGHALELTKLDLERKLGTRNPQTAEPLRPSILDFLANYRDLQQLGDMTPAQLYQKIEDDRVTEPDEIPPSSMSWRKGFLDVLAEHPEQRVALVELWLKVFPEDTKWLPTVGDSTAAGQSGS
jgi:hypothetical protein